KEHRNAYFFGSNEGFMSCPVHDHERLVIGAVIEGPAIVEQENSTIVIPPARVAKLDAHYNLIIGEREWPQEIRSRLRTCTTACSRLRRRWTSSLPAPRARCSGRSRATTRLPYSRPMATWSRKARTAFLFISAPCRNRCSARWLR